MCIYSYGFFIDIHVLNILYTCTLEFIHTHACTYACIPALSAYRLFTYVCTYMYIGIYIYIYIYRWWYMKVTPGGGMATVRRNRRVDEI